jgi:fructose-bisphosphate aldolase class II
MALLNPTELIRAAFESHNAIGAYNVDSVDMATGVIRGAEIGSSPIILQVTVDTLNIWGWTQFSHNLEELANLSNISVGFHLDHCRSVEDIIKAVDYGFTSVMYDGSILPMKENIENTQRVLEYGHRHNVMVEAELGHVGRRGEPSAWTSVTSMEEVSEFYSHAPVDCLAVAIGTQHGQQSAEDNIRYDRIQEIHNAVDVPLVLHGSSGVANNILQKLIPLGVSKVNIGTELRVIWWRFIKENMKTKPREALSLASDRIAQYVTEKNYSLSVR